MEEFLRVEMGEPSLPFFVRSFAKAASGSSSDDDDDDEDDDDEDDDDEDDDDPDAEKSEDELRAELKAVRASLSTASGSAKKKRDRIKSLTRELDEARKPKPKKGDDDGDDDIDEKLEAARREGASAALTRAKKAEAKSALLAAGVDPKRVGKAIGLLDLDELDLDEDGLDGIDEAIEDLRDSWGEMFARKRQRRQSIAGESDRDGSARKPKPKSASEQAAAKLLGRG